MNITDLKRTEKASVLSLKKLNKKYTERLMDVGIYESAEVTLLNTLAMGRLYLLEVDDIEICIRRDDALLIEVRK
ncbi:FeoA domain protein [Candidatus Izimaplasma bacterium HR1]|jgi:ferrous iron transport protein A|uniref:FeoA family protein n=1 Tax=Candidatus Izimoplasma sp. HR1 TaxID=1541959 RepID=UPI0004F5F8B1|nr:FeoA domain protein [Candidatus Izimaplasma bacterium HR1]